MADATDGATRSKWLVGVGIAVAVVAIGGVGYAIGAASGPDVVPATTSTTVESTTTTTTAPPTTTTTVPPATTLPTPTTVPMPHGGIGIEAAPRYGQGFPSGSCANWTLGFTNLSDTPIVEITFAPPSGHYSNLTDYVAGQGYPPDIPAEKPKAAVLNVYLGPGSPQQVLRFQTCSSTPPPNVPNYNFGATYPSTVAVRWSTGYTGTFAAR